MLRQNWRKFLTIAVALALVLPPLSGLMNKALGGDGSHVHFDHVWHQTSVDDILRHHADVSSPHQGESSPIHTHSDHVHIALMLGMATYHLDGVAIVRSYEQQPIFFQPGLSLLPPGHPPQALS
jgi:hypothetical protein